MDWVKARSLTALGATRATLIVGVAAVVVAVLAAPVVAVAAAPVVAVAAPALELLELLLELLLQAAATRARGMTSGTSHRPNL